MLYRLELENFKPFGEPQVLPLSRITLLYGPNSGGKSSVIQALLLLKQSVEENAPGSSSLIPRGHLIDLGSYLSLVHRHDLAREVRFCLHYDRIPSRRVVWAPPRDHSRSLELTFGSAKSLGSRKLDSSELRLTRYLLDDGSQLDVRVKGHLRASESAATAARGGPSDHDFEWADERSRRSLADYEWKLRRRRRSMLHRPLEDDAEPENGVDRDALIASMEEARLRPLAMLPAGVVPGAKARAVDSGAAARWSYGVGRVLEGMAWEFSELLGGVRYLGPLRAYPERHYVVSGGDSGSVGPRGERTPEVLYRRRKSLAGQVNRWFERLEIPYKLSLKSVADKVAGDIVIMQLVDRRTSTPVAPSDVGFGIGQLLPIVVEGCVAGGKILCVEQPEIHLHPRLQAHVADLLIETSAPDDRGNYASVRGGTANQWIVETHSEALILRIQRRIREGLLSPGDVSVLYVEPVEGRGSVVLPLHLSDDGGFLDEWPGGFFEESYREMLGEDRA